MTGDMDVKSPTEHVSKRVERIKKDWGIFFTPSWVIDFMVSLIDERRLDMNSLKILEPACGTCRFLLGIKGRKERIFRRAITKIGVEINEDLIEYSKRYILTPDIRVIHGDYLLWDTTERFDVIIGNPPYGIPSLSEHYTIRVDNETKRKYKQIYETWYGKYNVYGAFIEKSVKLLKENGQLIFIVPATFMILDEFKKLRAFLSNNGKTEIIYMGKDVFKPEADITTVILRFTKDIAEKERLYLFEYNDGNIKPIIQNNHWKGEIVLFSSDFSNAVDEICSFKIGDIYTIRISPRTPEIKHNPYVIKTQEPPDSAGLLPILNGRNLKIGRVIYEPITGYWIDKNDKTKLRKFFDKPHIVVALGFRGNGQVGAAYDYRAYPWMGDVYHLLRKPTLMNMKFNLSVDEVVSFLNSEVIKRYVKDVFKDITYHFNITQLKILPLPTKEELKRLKGVLSW